MNCILGSHSCADFTYSNGVLSCFTLVHTDLGPMQRSFKNPSFLQDCKRSAFRGRVFFQNIMNFISCAFMLWLFTFLLVAVLIYAYSEILARGFPSMWKCFVSSNVIFYRSGMVLYTCLGKCCLECSVLIIRNSFLMVQSFQMSSYLWYQK